MTKFKDLYTQLDTQLYNEIQNQYESRSATGLLQDVEQTTQWKKIWRSHRTSIPDVQYLTNFGNKYKMRTWCHKTKIKLVS